MKIERKKLEREKVENLKLDYELMKLESDKNKIVGVEIQKKSYLLAKE